MEWFESLFTIHSAVQTVVVLSLIVSSGLALGKIHIRGISLGVAFVFFIGIVAGSLHISADLQMLNFAETLGLSLLCVGHDTDLVGSNPTAGIYRQAKRTTSRCQ